MVKLKKSVRGEKMDIWILVIALLVIAIIFLVMSAFTKEGDVDEKIEKAKTHSKEELSEIKIRLADLEAAVIGATEEAAVAAVSAENVYYGDNGADFESESENLVVELEKTDLNPQVNERTREDIIRYYSQGYTLNEIAREVDLSMDAIQFVIDDYIENR